MHQGLHFGLSDCPESAPHILQNALSREERTNINGFILRVNPNTERGLGERALL